jgi:uncharacterized membrane protein YkoI
MENSNGSARRKLHVSRRMVIGLVLGLLLLAAIGGGAAIAADRVREHQSGGEIENIAPGAISVTDQQARDTVQAAYPDATIQEVDLDGEGAGDLVYDVGLDTGEEIMVSARTGQILGVETDDADKSSGEGEND